MIKAVIHVDYADAERQASGLGNVGNVISAAEGTTDIELVCHGPGISLLLREGNENASGVEKLLGKNVRVLACENTLKRKSLSPSDLIPGVETIPSGAFEVIVKQQEGYAYFRP